MRTDYTAILNRSKSQYSLNKKFVSLLAKRKIKSFDDSVRTIHEEVFADIQCTECAHCCLALGPRLNETDIDRIADHLRIKNSDFTVKYLKCDEDGDLVFNKIPCPFIGSDKLCSIYDERPRACKNYPHTDEKNIQGKLQQLLINTLYCPAAALILNRLKNKFSI
jgi:uncharacterized protein